MGIVRPQNPAVTGTGVHWKLSFPRTLGHLWVSPSIQGVGEQPGAWAEKCFIDKKTFYTLKCVSPLIGTNTQGLVMVPKAGQMLC